MNTDKVNSKQYGNVPTWLYFALQDHNVTGEDYKVLLRDFLFESADEVNHYNYGLMLEHIKKNLIDGVYYPTRRR